MRIPEGVDWELWRIVASPRFNVSGPNVLLYEWSLSDLFDAHAVLDMFDELDRRARQ